MDNENPHAKGAGASNVLGRNSVASTTPIPLTSIANGVPPAPVLRLLARHSRAELEGFITVAIDLLDVADGDPDCEPDADREEDDPPGQYDEDCYTGSLPRGDGPGCDISDPGGCEHDGREEQQEF